MPSARCRSTTPRSSAVIRGAAARPAASTSAWSSGSGEMPAAKFVTRLMPSTRAPRWRAAIVSSTVDMPTRSAPSVRSILISAGRLVRAAEQTRVHAFGQVGVDRVRERAQLRVVRLGEVAEARIRTARADRRRSSGTRR